MSAERLIILSVFFAVFLASVAASAVLARSRQLRRRLAQPGPGDAERDGRGFARALVAKNFDEAYFRLDPAARSELRKSLIRAGFFSPDAVPIYLAARFGLSVGLPLLGFLYGSYLLPGSGWWRQFALSGLLFALAMYLPTAYLARRTTALETSYRETFPDMMDWMLVCVDAGLSLEAALDRISRELHFLSPALAVNLTLVTAEIRAGRSTIEALQLFAERVGIEEAASLATLLRQSTELGASIGQALRVYSDEMRDRRMSRAEERAHQLPVKLMLPMGMFIFPNIMLIIFLPIVSRFLNHGLIPSFGN